MQLIFLSIPGQILLKKLFFLGLIKKFFFYSSDRCGYSLWEHCCVQSVGGEKKKIISPLRFAWHMHLIYVVCVPSSLSLCGASLCLSVCLCVCQFRRMIMKNQKAVPLPPKHMITTRLKGGGRWLFQPQGNKRQPVNRCLTLIRMPSAEYALEPFTCFLCGTSLLAEMRNTQRQAFKGSFFLMVGKF